MQSYALLQCNKGKVEKKEVGGGGGGEAFARESTLIQNPRKSLIICGFSAVFSRIANLPS